MRNLKKILALVLALMMVLSVMVTASAADYADAAEIEHVEAVEVLSALKVLQGDGTNFNPKGILNRAEAAVIIAKVLEGSVDGIANLVDAVSNPFTDVPAWALDYVLYAYSQGIVIGTGADKYSPSDKLTGYQFGKMLLIAAGICESEDFTADGWKLTVATEAKDAGLLAGLSDIKLSQELSREHAAQMAFNAMNYGTPVEKVDTYNVYEIIPLTATYTGNADLVAAAAVTYDTFGAAVAAVVEIGGVTYNTDYVVTSYVETLEYTIYEDTLMEDVFECYPMYDMVNGRVVYAWGIDGEEITSYYQGDLLLKTVYSQGDSLAALTTKTSPYYVGVQLDDSVDYYLNGVQKTAGDVAGIIDNLGVVIDLVDQDFDGYCDTVCVIEKTVARLTATPTTTTVGTTTYITVGDAGIVNKNIKLVSGYEDLARGDVVLYVNMADGTTVIEEITPFTGTVSGNYYYVNGYYYALIGENSYTNSELPGTTYNYYDITDTEEYAFYLDNSGAIVMALPLTGLVVSNYAVVTDFAWVTPNVTGALGEVSRPYAQAKLVYTDGTSEIVTVSSVNGYSLVDDATLINAYGLGFYATSPNPANVVKNNVTAAATATAMTAGNYYAFAATSKGDIAAKAYAVDTAADLSGEFGTDHFYTYTVNQNGSVNLSTAALYGNTYGDLAADYIKNGKAVFNGANVGNEETVFVYATSDVYGNYTYTVYTGISNAPSTLNAISAAADTIVVGADGVADYVYVDLAQGNTAVDTADIVYIDTNSTYTEVTGSNPYYIQTCVLNGVVTTINVASVQDPGFYQVVKTVNGISVLEPLAGSVGTGIESTAANTLKVGNGAYTYAAGTPAYVIGYDVYGRLVSSATTVEALTLDATDKVLVVSSNGVAYAVYVVSQSQAPGSVSLNQTYTNTATELAASGTEALSAPNGHKVEVTATAQAGTIVKSVSINGVDVNTVTGGSYTFTKNGTYSVIVTIIDGFSGALSSHTYTFTITGF